MNIESSVQRLPSSIRRLIETEPQVKERIAAGEALEQILRSADWGAAWLRTADETVVETLRLILVMFAGTVFEPAALSRAAEERGRLTGAEVRVASARLRRSGILFAVRKTWGDRLFYIPADMLPLWQSLILPVRGEALTERESSDVQAEAHPFRLPLGLQMILAWLSVHRHPLTFTSKGLLQRPPVARMTSDMLLTPEELAFLSLTYPGHEQIPSNAALAIDFGMCCGVLHREGGAIRVSDTGLQAWLAQAGSAAEARLHALALERLSSADPGLHLAACAVHSLPAFQWFKQEQLLPFCGDPKKIHHWLALLQSFGWLEKGTYRQEPVFRKNCDLDGTPVGTQYEESGLFFVQPDGEIIAPPDVSLADRWMLEQIAERVTIDVLFVYRLTREACEKACNAGYSYESVTEFLKRGSGEQLPEAVAGALRDWFERLGKVRFAQLTMLRAESSEVAARLRHNPEIAQHLTEQIGEKDFIVDSSALKALSAALQKMGYPAAETSRQSVMASDAPSAAQSSVDSKMADQQGWLYLRHLIDIYEPDHTFPTADDLFPGVSDIPAAWIRQSRAYHVSTRKEMIQRAIRWQAPVRIGDTGHTFVPKSFEEQGGDWRVFGQWHNGDDSVPRQRETVAAQPADFCEMMILLPPLDEFESS